MSTIRISSHDIDARGSAHLIDQSLSQFGFPALQELQTNEVPMVCVVYVLVFADGWAYVGQTTNAHSRILEHLRRWPDIHGYSFKVIDQKDLKDTERQLIFHLESRGFVYLRNKDIVSNRFGVSSFDEVL